MNTRDGMSEALGLETFEAPGLPLFLQVPTGRPERVQKRDLAYHQGGKRMRSPRDSPLGCRGKADAIF